MRYQEPCPSDDDYPANRQETIHVIRNMIRKLKCGTWRVVSEEARKVHKKEAVALAQQFGIEDEIDLDFLSK